MFTIVQAVTAEKNSYAGVIQRYNCKNCNRNWTQIPGQDLIAKRSILALAFRSIGHILGVSNVTVLKWISQALFNIGTL